MTQGRESGRTQRLIFVTNAGPGPAPTLDHAAIHSRRVVQCVLRHQDSIGIRCAFDGNSRVSCSKLAARPGAISAHASAPGEMAVWRDGDFNHRTTLAGISFFRQPPTNNCLSRLDRQFPDDAIVFVGYLIVCGCAIMDAAALNASSTPGNIITPGLLLGHAFPGAPFLFVALVGPNRSRRAQIYRGCSARAARFSTHSAGLMPQLRFPDASANFDAGQG